MLHVLPRYAKPEYPVSAPLREATVGRPMLIEEVSKRFGFEVSGTVVCWSDSSNVTAPDILTRAMSAAESNTQDLELEINLGYIDPQVMLIGLDLLLQSLGGRLTQELVFIPVSKAELLLRQSSSQ